MATKSIEWVDWSFLYGNLDMNSVIQFHLFHLLHHTILEEWLKNPSMCTTSLFIVSWWNGQSIFPLDEMWVKYHILGRVFSPLHFLIPLSDSPRGRFNRLLHVLHLIGHTILEQGLTNHLCGLNLKWIPYLRKGWTTLLVSHPFWE